MTGCRRRQQHGSVALETALVLPLVALLVAGVAALGRVATDQLVAERVARATARTVAVTGSARTTPALPPGATVDVRRRAGVVTVVVSVRSRVMALEHRVQATATAAIEPAAS